MVVGGLSFSGVEGFVLMKKELENFVKWFYRVGLFGRLGLL